MHIYLCVRAGARELGRSLARMGVGWGGGGAGAGAGAGAAPWDCLRHAKGAPDGDLRDGGVGWGWGWGWGWNWCSPLGLPEARQGAPDGDPRDGRLVSWKPNAEGLAGCAEATQVCSGSQCPGHPAPGGAGAAGAQELGRGVGAKGEGRQRAYSTRYTQAVSHPSTNQARPCLASEIR